MNKDESNLYTYYSAKKIYFAHTPSKYLLIEKNDTNSLVLSLVSRNTVVISKDNGILLFPNNK